MKCCLCGKEIKDFGNNPWPLKENEDDRCCDDCNVTKVIPARITNLKQPKTRGVLRDGSK